MSRLPEKDTTESDNLIKTYLTCNSPTVDKLAEQYGYADRRNFTDAMRRRYGARRERTPKITQEAPELKNSFIKGTGKALALDVGKECKEILIINDLHIPYHDPITVSLVIKVIKDLQPDYICLNGDVIDFYNISRFSTDPSRRLSLQDDLDLTRCILREIKDSSNAKIFMCAGNHEDRLRLYLWNKAPELSELRALDIRRQLGLDIFGIDYAPYDSIVKVNDIFKIEHGDSVSKHSGWTAKAMYEKRGGCGIVGHSHRFGSHLKTIDDDTQGWYENACLCDLNPEYVKNPNWQQGFAVVTFIGKRFFVQQVPIIKHKFVFRGKLYE